MRPKKPSKNNSLNDILELREPEVRLLFAATSTLLRAIVAIHRAKPLAGKDARFIKKVISDFRATFIQNQAVVERQARFLALEGLAQAYAEKEPRKRRRMIEDVIAFTRSRLPDARRSQIAEQQLHQPIPARRSGRSSPRELAFERVEHLCDYSRAEYFRDKKESKKLGLELAILQHFGGDENAIVIIGVVSKVLFGFDRVMLEKLFELLQKNDYQTLKLPFNNGLKLMKFLGLYPELVGSKK